jgi:hypothetical protein
LGQIGGHVIDFSLIRKEAMLYFSIFVLVVCAARFVQDCTVYPVPSGFRPAIDFVTIIWAACMIVALT